MQFFAYRTIAIASALTYSLGRLDTMLASVVPVGILFRQVWAYFIQHGQRTLWPLPEGCPACTCWHGLEQ